MKGLLLTKRPSLGDMEGGLGLRARNTIYGALAEYREITISVRSSVWDQVNQESMWL